MNDDILAFRSSMFYRSLNTHPGDLGGGAEAWTGFSTSVVINKDMVSYSIDMNASAFVKADSLENLVYEIRRFEADSPPFDARKTKELTKKLSKLKVLGGLQQF